MTRPCKMIYLARRNPALAPAAFAQAWREHSALGRQCRNVQDKVTGVAQCSRLLDVDVPGASRDYDGVGLLRLRDRAAAQAIWGDPETLAIMRLDEPRVFSTYVRDFTLVAEEQVLREVRADGAVVLYGFLRRHAGCSPQQFAAQWAVGSAAYLDGPIVAASCGVVHNQVVEAPPGYDYDAVVEWWFADAAALTRACGKGNVRTALPRAIGALADLGASVFVATGVTHRRG